MEKIKRLLSFSVLLMITLSFCLVLLSYFLNITFIPLQELTLYLHAIIFMIGIVVAYRSNDHVRIDVFFQKFTLRTQNKINLFGTAFLLLPLFVFIPIISFNYVISSWQMHEGSAETGGLPLVFVLKSLLLIMPILMVFSAIVKISGLKKWK